MQAADIYEMPSVSVLVLTYGNYSGLLRTVESVLTQEFPIQKLILSDDASGEPFPTTVLEKLSEGKMEVVVRSNTKNQGTTAHMNSVAGLCDSKYLKFISSGDSFADSKALGDLIDFAEREQTLVVTSDAKVCSENLKRRYYTFPGRRGTKLNCDHETLYRTLAQANIVSAVGSLFRIDFFRLKGGLDEEYRLLEDWPAWLRLSREGERIPHLNRITCCYALGGVSSSNGNAYTAPTLREDMIRCYEKEILPYTSNFSEKERKRISYHYEKLKDKPGTYYWSNYFLQELKTVLKQRIKSLITST